MKNKRIFLAILSALLIVALTGCSGSGEFGSFTASTLDGGSSVSYTHLTLPTILLV